MKKIKSSSRLISLLKAIKSNVPKGNHRFYSKVILLHSTPNESEVAPNKFIVVRYKGIDYWAMFRCPCKCGKLISLSLQHTWSVSLPKGYPTLFPSVWQTDGCYSHFWIRNGRVLWCEDTGLEPWKAKPYYYSKEK